jgi:tagaturonate reductase
VARFAEATGAAPPALAFGLAAFLAFARGTLQARRRAAGQPVPADDQLAQVEAHWVAHLPALAGDVDGSAPNADAPAASALAPFVRAVLADAALWGADLAVLPGVADAVTDQLARILAEGADAALAALLAAPAPTFPTLAGAAS